MPGFEYVAKKLAVPQILPADDGRSLASGFSVSGVFTKCNDDPTTLHELVQGRNTAMPLSCFTLAAFGLLTACDGRPTYDAA